MKLCNIKPASTSITTKLVLVFISLLMAVITPIQMVQIAHADQYDDQISTLQQNIDAYNVQAAQLAAQAKTLQAAIAELQNQSAVIQTQINISQIKYDQLVSKIADTEKQIKDNQDALGTVIANMYVDDRITPIEMLASSKNIGDYLDKQEYSASVRNQLASTISTIKNLKSQLDKQKADVESVLEKQKAQKAGLVANQEQQQSLLDQTKGQEAEYQQLVSNSRQELANTAARQRAYYQSLLNSGGGNSGVVGSFQYTNWSGNSPCGSDGYPYCGVQDSYSDPWALYNRECVSYVAWALSSRFGRYVGSFNGSGNAYEWPSSAPRYSGAYRVSNPQPGDAVVLPMMGDFSPIGHLMIVESVSGGWVHVSQYNFYGTGEYSTMDIKTSGVVFLRFQSK